MNNTDPAENKQLNNSQASASQNKDTQEEQNPLFDQQWQALSQDWQSQPFDKVDIKALLKQTQKRTFWAKFLLALDIIATLAFIITVVVMWFNDSQDQATMAYLGFGAVISVVFVYYEVKYRLATWQQGAASPELAIENAINGIKSSISYIRLIKLFCFILLPAANWYVITITQQMDKPIWPSMLFINSFIVLIWGGADLFHRKRKLELANLRMVNSK